MNRGLPLSGGEQRDRLHERLRRCTVLVVDDEEANLDLLEALLEDEGYTSIVRVGDARQVMAVAAQRRPDVVLLDLHMPHRHGLELLKDLRAVTPPDEYLPVLVLTADVTAEAKERALREGARDFLTKPFDAVEVLLRVENLLETRLLHLDQRAARALAEAAEGRAALLAEWSRRLAASMDATTALTQFPALLVPEWVDGAVALDGGDASQPVSEGWKGDAAEWRDALVTAAQGAASPAGVRELQLSDDRRIAVVAAPVTLGASATGACVATLVVARRAPAEGAGTSPAFSAEEVALVGELARRAGLAAERARLFAAAELATRERERLLAVVAHDLRNPLAVVAMYAEMLASLHPEGGGASDDYTRTALSTIHRTTAGMQALVEDLLDASTLREGALRLEVTEHDAGELFTQAERMLRPLAAASGVALVVRGQANGTPTRVRADAGRLGQVLSNLVGNAIRFSPPGGTVTVHWQPDESGVSVSVTDEGGGIAPDELPHIFTAFWQGKAHDRRGAGLGLWIARAIVEGHGGEIGVASAPGEGATFRFTLPADGKPRRWED